MAKRLALAALLVAQVAAMSQANAVETDVAFQRFMLSATDRPGGGWTVGVNSGFPGSATYSTATESGAKKFLQSQGIKVAGRAGELAFTATVRATLADGASAIARCVLGGGPLCMAATAAGLVYAGYRVYSDSGSLWWDPGQSTATIVGWKSARYPTLCVGSLLSVRTCEIAEQTRLWNVSNPSFVVLTVPLPHFQVPPGSGQFAGFEWGLCARPASTNPMVVPPNLNSCAMWAASGAMPTSSSYQECPATIDPFDPALSRAAGQPVGPDGKCPTARYSSAAGARAHTQVDDQVAASKVVAYPPTFPHSQWAEAMKAAIESRQSAPGMLTTSGPATQTGTPATTTSVNGGNTTVTTVTPTYTYNYAGDTITYIAGDTTTTTVNGVLTNTTTTNVPPKESQDPDDPCTANPTRAGCADLGDAPDDKPEWTEKPVEYAPVSVGPAGSCPAPYDMVIRGWTLRLNYQPACDVAPIIRLGILALAALGAAMTIITTVNK